MRKSILFFIRLFLISVFLITTSNVSAQNHPLKIISYNIFIGMKTDTTAAKSKFSAWVKQNDPDILALQEVNKFTQSSLEALARSYNHPYAVLLKEPGYPVALTSKYPIVNVEKVIDNMHHGFIKAEVNGYTIIVVHLSPHKYWKRQEEIELILATVNAQSSHKKTLIMGDFNSLSILDAGHYANGEIRQKYSGMEKTYAQHENLVNGEIDYEVHNKVLKFGFLDAVKTNNKAYESSRPTLILSDNGGNTSSRIDYIYISKDLKKKVTAAGIIKDKFTDIYSDHYPVYVELTK